MFDAYEVLLKENLTDIGAEGTLLAHRKTGARVVLISNKDENKVFNIGFRTPPDDSTGVAHIIEHSVLCGSKKFPLKDPFLELAKGSLNTFVNAMTFPDKTVYPVASCNDKDFRNLMEVYLDSVFYPNIYETGKIFMQEGWHYHLENKDDPITYNGVVYNEMKGAFSESESVLERTVFNSLFPDTSYGVESGGDPVNIPDLTYEQFLDFHRTYYHPSNSYIYLYGNMDMDAVLSWIDAEYLSGFERKEIDSHIDVQEPFDEPRRIELEYPVLDGEPLEDNTFLSASFVVPGKSDPLKNLAFSILEYVLLDAPGAVLKQALLDAGVGKSVTGGYNDGILQPFFDVETRFANPEDCGLFEKTIKDTLSDLADRGIDRKSLEAAIHFYEFRYREADFASYPTGLIYGLSVFESWLYDDGRPFDYLKQLVLFEELKQKADTGYFEELIRTDILGNPHCCYITLKPAAGLAARKEQELADKLAAYRESLTEEELDAIVRQTQELDEYQKTDNTPEQIATLPVLERSDLDRKTHFEFSNIESEAGAALILKHHFDTRGIAYVDLLFDLADIPEDLLKALGLFKSVIGMVDTKNYTYRELSDEINSGTGGISCGIVNYNTPDGSRKFFNIKAKCLYPELDFAFSMIKEIIVNSLFTDKKRLYEIISAEKSQYQMGLAQAGHITASARALAAVNESAGWSEQVRGIEYYRFVEDLFAGGPDRLDTLEDTFKELSERIFRPEKLTVSITAEECGTAKIEEIIQDLNQCLHTESLAERPLFDWKRNVKKEAFRTSGQVQFVAEAGNFKDKGYEYTGLLKILRVVLNYDYLWQNLRVLGGAYGCMGAFRRDGSSFLVSYRDPHLQNTLDVYAGLPDYLRDFDADEREMTQFIIGAISELDTPQNARAKGALSLTVYFAGLTIEDMQRERDEVLDAEPALIRGLADLIGDTLDGTNICVIGSETAVNGHSEIFDHIESLITV